MRAVTKLVYIENEPHCALCGHAVRHHKFGFCKRCISDPVEDPDKDRNIPDTHEFVEKE